MRFHVLESLIGDMADEEIADYGLSQGCESRDAKAKVVKDGHKDAFVGFREGPYYLHTFRPGLQMPKANFEFAPIDNFF